MSDIVFPNDFNATEISENLSILPVLDVVLFPRMVTPLEIDHKESILLAEEAVADNRIIGLLVVKSERKEHFYTHENLYRVGTSGFILKLARVSDEKAHLLIQGLGRFKVKSFTGGKPFLRARVSHVRPEVPKDKETDALVYTLLKIFDKTVSLHPAIPPEMVQIAAGIHDPGILADMVVSCLNATSEENQRILEAIHVKTRLREAVRLATRQLEYLELGYRIQTRVKGDMDRQEREFYLREQLRAIQAELGDETRPEIAPADYRTKMSEKTLSEEARKEGERELKRLERMSPSSAEFMVATTYIDWLVNLPWQESTDDKLDIRHARKVLDKDHFGLNKPKRRIKSIDKKLAMAGEISLRGHVLPINDVEDKILAAHRTGIKEVVLPKANQKDLGEIPTKVRRDIRIHLVNQIAEATRIALQG